MKKSVMARLVPIYLRLFFKKKNSRSREEEIKKLNKQKINGELPYLMPKNIKFNFPITKENQDIDVYYLNGQSSLHKTIFYIHGGGYIRHPIKFHWKFINKLCKLTNAKIVFPIYPVAPFSDFLNCHEKLLKVYLNYIETHPNEEIIFMGDSSGGGLCLSLQEYLIKNNLRRANKVILLSPWVDIATDNPKSKEIEKIDPMHRVESAKVWAEFWAGKENYKNYLVSPTYFDNLELLENIFIITGTVEILYPDIHDFFEKIKSNKNCKIIEAHGMNHVYPLYPIREAKIAIREIVNEINK